MATLEKWLAAAVGIAFALSTPLGAVDPAKLTGTLAGRVMDAAGVPQMGATVFLFNRYDRMVARLLTNDRGAFQFDQLAPDNYSVRVRLASFVPALKRNIAIQPGMRSFLAINLNSMLSSIELVYTSPRQAALMSDDWKWVLRSAGSTRPILRVVDKRIDITDPALRQRRPLFSGTRGLFRISSGESEGLGNFGTQADLGTAFALATSVYGFANVSVSGNFGYASNTGTPTAGFSTSFSRTSDGSSPSVHVTMRQMMLPNRIGNALTSMNGDLPAFQTMSLTYMDRRDLVDGLSVEYGSSIESVSFLSRLNYVSPFARVTVGSVKEGALEFGYSYGAPATHLLDPGDISNNAELQHNLNTLSLFPRVSLRGGRAEIQRSQNLELGYRRAIGSRTFSASAYREGVSNTALNAVTSGGVLTGDLLPDLATRTSVFNAGRYERMGYTAAVSQQLGDHVNASVTYGYNGALATKATEIEALEAPEVRSLLARTGRHSVTAKVAGTAPTTGTRYMASYQVTDYSVLSPVHLSLTQRTTIEPGLNFYLRQPIPRIGGIVPGRLEATAEVRNVLGQGYLPIATPGGHKLVLIQTPKAIRGGLSLIF